MIKTRAVFLDKDGTLIEDIPYNVDPESVHLIPFVVEGLRLLQKHGYELFVVTNQSGLAKGLFSEKALLNVLRHLYETLAQQGVILNQIYFCPHDPRGLIKEFSVPCLCRKPMPGMLKQAAMEHDIALDQSWIIGDILHDIESGRRAGCRTILIDNGNETEWEITSLRQPHFIVPDVYAAAKTILSNR